uniref:Phosphatidylinositol-glycan biosynthesis class W protein n=1 Tax=Pectinophora gossypiella TaxID=13191 RepID=A0A1E1W172_PECGO
MSLWSDWEGSAMNASEYKKYHESYMENNHGASPLYTFFCIFFTVKCTIYCAIKKNYSVSSYVIEYLLIVLTMISLHFYLNKYMLILNLITSMLLVYELLQQDLQFVKTLKQPNQFPTKHIQSITCIRGLTYLITVFAILAVDFKAFPRKMAKTERYGYSFMDTGVGLFVIISGLVHKDLKTEKLKNIIKSNTKFISVLVTLGVARFWTVKALEYQEHVTEYGVHWNFFFTLAVCKLTSTIILYFTDKALLCSLVTILTHEFLLYNGLQSWVFSNAPRTDLISANREGIASCLGYTTLYLFAVYVKQVLDNKTTPRYVVLVKFVSIITIFWVLLYILAISRPVSRVLANTSYCLYVSATILTILTLFYFFEVLFQQKDKKIYFIVPMIISAVNQNGLLYFLVANLLTGIINLSICTLFVPKMESFLIVNCYMIITIALTVLLKKLGVKI